MAEHVAEQAEFHDTQLKPRLDAAAAGQGHVFFVDAAHFVFGTFLGCLWSFTRIFVRAASGRQRFNVLGGPVRIFVSASRLGLCIVGYPLTSGMRSSNMIAKWFKAAFQLRIGIFHFFDASLIAR